jgi:hypothetical protein
LSALSKFFSLSELHEILTWSISTCFLESASFFRFSYIRLPYGSTFWYNSTLAYYQLLQRLGYETSLFTPIKPGRIVIKRVNSRWYDEFSFVTIFISKRKWKTVPLLINNGTIWQ